MGSLSNYTENKVLNHVLKTASFTQPTNLYIGLSTSDPTDAGTGIAEPSGNGYARVINNSWSTAASRSITNSAIVTFAEATGTWGTVSHFFISDAITGGNVIAHGSLTASKLIGAGDNASFQSSSITVAFSAGAISTYLANKILDHTFKKTAYTVPTNICVGLSTANPGDTASGNAEHVGDNYARVTMNVWNNSTTGSTANTNAITFPQASASWGTITHFAIWDASTVGNMLFYGALDASRAIGVNDTPSYAAGACIITLD